MQKLSDYVIEFIARQGVKHVFLVPGGGAMHLNDSLANCAGLEYVCNLHEQASSIAAETYAKATGSLGAALLTTGPGCTNAITGLAGAWLDSTPCIFVSGQVKRADRMVDADGTPLGVRQVGVQEVDIVSVVSSLTKYAVTVVDPTTIRYHLEKAAFLARSDRPGPVWIDIPLDVQASPIEPAELAGFEPPQRATSVSGPELRAAVRDVLAALQRAQQPLVLVGNGVRLAAAQADFRRLVDELDVPVEATWLAIDLIEEDHPRFVGRPGSIAPRGANFAIANCDFLLAIGARLDRVVTAFAPERFAARAHKVMVDIDPAELRKMDGSVQQPICADAGAFIRELLAQAAGTVMPDRGAWNARCEVWKRRYPVVLPEHRTPAGPVSTYNFSRVMSEELAEGDFIVSGSSGSAIELFLLAFGVKRGQRIFHTTALGSMGFGIAAAIGASLAGGRKRTICVDGDGGFFFNIQELETVARLGLPITFFVMNNDGYASIRASQTNYFGSPKLGCDARTGQTLPDVCRVAEAFGIQTDRIVDQSNLRADVRRILDRAGPLVCDVTVVRDEIRQPRLSSVQLPDGSFVSAPMEDLWPFLARAEFDENMASVTVDA